MADPNVPPTSSDGPKDAVATNRVAIIQALAALRRDRDNTLGMLLADPGWKMLLELYINLQQDRQTLVKSICLASEVPTTTALRCLRTLEDKGLVSRKADPEDRRRVFVFPTRDGRQAVERAIDRIGNYNDEALEFAAAPRKSAAPYLLNHLDDHPRKRGELRHALSASPPTGSEFGRLAKSYQPLIRHVYPRGSGALEAHLYASNQTGTPLTHFGDFDLLETHRSDVALLARFSQHVDHATWYLCVAIDTQIERSVWQTPGVKARRAAGSWLSVLAKQCFSRWRTTRNLLVHDWAIPEAAEALYRTAFWSLCELTPADNQLKLLFEEDRFRAARELVKHIDAYAAQLALATDLAETMAAVDGAADMDPKARLNEIQQALLGKAGDRLTLTQAAERLNISRQALHKKIKTGAALGLMVGETFVLPGVQLIESESGTAVVSHLRDVLSLFTEAGAGDWSALQYLIEPDPALSGLVPLDRLKAGDVKAVVEATRAYLGLDDG